MTGTRVFFATDIHGSERCFRKFLNAGNVYGARVLILGGDFAGGPIIPIVRKVDGAYSCWVGGKELRPKSQDEVDSVLRAIRDSGSYPYIVDYQEAQDLDDNVDSKRRLLRELARRQIQDWVELSVGRLRGTGMTCCLPLDTDNIIENERSLEGGGEIVNSRGRVVEIGEGYEMVTPKTSHHWLESDSMQADEDATMKEIESLAAKVKNPGRSIFNIHRPPVNTAIDQTPGSLTVSRCCGQLVSSGSAATRRMIEEYQPLMGVHGHFHESRGVAKVGKTLCFNPGSEYESGILRGLICDLENDSIKSYLLTSG